MRLRPLLARIGLLFLLAMSVTLPMTAIYVGSNHEVSAATKKGKVSRTIKWIGGAAAGAATTAAAVGGWNYLCANYNPWLGWLLCPGYDVLQTTANMLMEQIANRLEWNLVNISDNDNKASEPTKQADGSAATGGGVDSASTSDGNIGLGGGASIPSPSDAAKALTDAAKTVDSATKGSSDDDAVNHLMDTTGKITMLANILFAIAFLFMLYSIATSSGLSNYSVKRLLPRLVVLAVAVNISFYVCMLLMDASNIAGKAIYGLLVGDPNRIMQVDATVAGNLKTAASAGMLVLVVIVCALFAGTAVIALIFVLFALVFREAALTVLTVVSPLAFACLLLPNTKTIFDKWFSNYTKMLMVYPMFMAVWGASQWCMGLLADTKINEDVSDKAIAAMMGYGLMIAPAFALKPLLKSSGSLMGMATNQLERGANSKLAKSFEGGVNGFNRNMVFNKPRRFATKTLAGAANAVGKGGGVMGSAMSRALMSGAGHFGQKLNDQDDKAIKNTEPFIAMLSNGQKKQIYRTGSYTDNGKTKYVSSDVRRAVERGMDKDKITIEDKIEAFKSIHQQYGGSNSTITKNARKELIEALGTIPLTGNLLNEYLEDISNGKISEWDDIEAKVQEAQAKSILELDYTKQATLSDAELKYAEKSAKRYDDNRTANTPSALAKLKENSRLALSDPAQQRRLSQKQRMEHMRLADDASTLNLSDKQKFEIATTGKYTVEQRNVDTGNVDASLIDKSVSVGRFTLKTAIRDIDVTKLSKDQQKQLSHGLIRLAAQEKGIHRDETMRIWEGVKGDNGVLSAKHKKALFDGGFLENVQGIMDRADVPGQNVDAVHAVADNYIEMSLDHATIKSAADHDPQAPRVQQWSADQLKDINDSLQKFKSSAYANSDEAKKELQADLDSIQKKIKTAQDESAVKWSDEENAQAEKILQMEIIEKPKEPEYMI